MNGKTTMIATRAGVAAAALLSAAACATTARVTLLDRFQAIGIPERTAACMVDDLDENLSADDLTDLARYTLRISRAPTTTAAVAELVKIDNPRAVAAVGQATVSCIAGIDLGGMRR